MPLIGFLCAFIPIILGSGPGLFVMTALFYFDLNPASASGTGMYLTMFTTISATVTAVIFKQIDLPYFAAFSICSIIGAIPGLYF